MNPGVYGPLDSATNLYTGLPINKQMVSREIGFSHPEGSVRQGEASPASTNAWGHLPRRQKIWIFLDIPPS